MRNVTAWGWVVLFALAAASDLGVPTAQWLLHQLMTGLVIAGFGAVALMAFALFVSVLGVRTSR